MPSTEFGRAGSAQSARTLQIILAIVVILVGLLVASMFFR